MSLHVTHINGNQLKQPIDILEIDIEPAVNRGDLDGTPTDGRIWRWNARWNSHTESPQPRANEEWELRGVQSGDFRGYPDEVWKELDTKIDPGSGGPFITTFHYTIATRLR